MPRKNDDAAELAALDALMGGEADGPDMSNLTYGSGDRIRVTAATAPDYLIGSSFEADWANITGKSGVVVEDDGVVRGIEALFDGVPEGSELIVVMLDGATDLIPLTAAEVVAETASRTA
jgi:hypothetical protein